MHIDVGGTSEGKRLNATLVAFPLLLNLDGVVNVGGIPIGTTAGISTGYRVRTASPNSDVFALASAGEVSKNNPCLNRILKGNRKSASHGNPELSRHDRDWCYEPNHENPQEELSHFSVPL